MKDNDIRIGTTILFNGKETTLTAHEVFNDSFDLSTCKPLPITSENIGKYLSLFATSEKNFDLELDQDTLLRISLHNKTASTFLVSQDADLLFLQEYQYIHELQNLIMDLKIIHRIYTNI